MVSNIAIMISDIIKETKKLGILLQQAEQQITEAGELLKIAKEKHVEISESLKSYETYSTSSTSTVTNYYFAPKESGSNVFYSVPKTMDGRV